MNIPAVSSHRRGLLHALLILALTACASQADNDNQWVENNELYQGPKDAGFSKMLEQDGISYETRGDEFYAAKEFDKALYAYLRALATDENNSGLYVKIGATHRQRGVKSLAAAALNKALKIDAQNVAAFENLGLLALRGRSYQLAARHFRNAIKADNRRLEAVAATSGAAAAPLHDALSPYRAYNGLGVVLDLQYRFREAVAFYRTAASIRPGAAYITNNIGYSFYLADRWHDSEHYFKKAIRTEPAYDKARRNLALLQVQLKDYNDALATLWSFLQISEAYNTVGFLCMLTAQYDVAEQYFVKAIDLSPSYYALAMENLEKNRAMQRSELAIK